VEGCSTSTSGDTGATPAAAPNTTDSSPTYGAMQYS
jgi:hypothetical protein